MPKGYMVRGGQILKKLRTDQGFTQATLASRLGVTEASISRWETGDVRPDDQTRANVAHILGVDPCNLFIYPPPSVP